MFRIASTIIGLLAASSITTAHEKCLANLTGLDTMTTNSSLSQNSTCALPTAAHDGSITNGGISERRQSVVNFGDVKDVSSFDDDGDDEDAKLGRLVAWIKEHGGIIDAVKVSTISGYRGVVAARNMKRGDFGLTIPEKLFISLISVLEDATLGPIYKANMDLFKEDEYLILAVFLVHHKQLQNESFYFPYLSLLPEPETIDNWTDDELSALQDTNIIKDAFERKHEMFHAYQNISARLFRKYPEVFSPDMFPFHMFRSAYQTVNARCFRVSVQNCSTKFEGVCPGSILVPFVDLLNHATHGNGWYGYDNRFHWHPAVTYREGEQVFLSYGEKSNDDLLNYYGFALEQNEFDTFDLDIDPATYSVPHIELHEAPTDLSFTLSMRTNIEKDILPYVRRLFLPAQKSKSIDTDVLGPLSRELERQVLDFIGYYVKQQLKSYPTTLEQDIAYFDIHHKQNNLPHKLYAALVYRISRKRILQHVLSKVTEALEHLNIDNDGITLGDL